MTLLADRPPEIDQDVRPAEPAEVDLSRMREPGGRGGLLEVFRSRVIVQMLVRRDIRVKYRTSSIGFLWGYVRPTIHFCVYYFVIGIVLDMERRVENFAVYAFSGLALLHFFNDTMGTGTKSIMRNRSIVKKIWLPREIFPVAALFTAGFRFIPQLLILMVGATLTGWYFTWTGLAAAITGFAIIAIWGMASALMFSAFVVYVREIQNFLDFSSFLTHWLTPMIKPWTLVAERASKMGWFGPILLGVYIWNPLCTGLELFHLAFWEPTVDFYFELSPYLWTRAYIMFGAGLVMLGIAQLIFRRLQVHFVEEL